MPLEPTSSLSHHVHLSGQHQQVVKERDTYPSPPAGNYGMEPGEQSFEAASVAELEARIDLLNEEMNTRQRAVRFALDTDTQEVTVQVVDRKTNSVIREIPNNELLRFVDSPQSMTGVVLHERG